MKLNIKYKKIIYYNKQDNIKIGYNYQKIIQKILILNVMMSSIKLIKCIMNLQPYGRKIENLNLLLIMGVIKKMGGMEMRIVGFVKIKRSKIKYKRNGQVYHTAC